MRSLLLTATLLTLVFPLRAAEPCTTLDDESVAALFDDWNFSLSSLDAAQVVQRYWPNAVLLPTVSNTPRTNAAMIGDYFEHFLAKRPRGRIDTRTIQSDCNLAVDMGTYTFSLMDDKGTTSEVAARYTFVYQYRDGAWKILHHHSSAMPEAGANAAPDTHATGDDAATASGPAKHAQSESASPKARKQRRAKLKDYLEPYPVAAKPHQKPVTPPVGETKAAAPAKATPDAKSPAVAKATPPKPDAKPAPETKPAPDANASAVANAPTDAKLPPEVRTAMFANLTASPAPARFYPPEAARRKEHGNVNLKVCADATGTVSDSMEIITSSGSKLLDDAAMSWAREVSWVPATFNSRRVEGCAKVIVSFEPPPDLVHARR